MAAAAALPALLALLGAAWLPGPAAGMQVWVSNPSTVALLFQPVVLRCSYQSTASAPPIVTWKYKSFCGSTSAFSAGGGSSSAAPSSSQDWDAASACPDASRTVRIVATKQGNAVTLGDFYQGRSVTITDGAELSLGPAAWGDSGVYICTVTSAQDLEGNNEAVAELVVLVYLAGKAATSGAGSDYRGLYAAPPKGPPPPAIALGPIGNGYGYSGASVSGHSSQVPLLRDTDSNLGSVPAAPPAAPPSMRVLRYLEDELNAFEPHGRYPPSGAGAPSDISSLHEAPDAWAPPGAPRVPPRSRSPPRGRWHSVEDLGSSRGGSPPPSRPRSRSRDDLLGGAAPLPRLPPVGPPGPPRRLRKNDAMSRESLVV
ncbi:lipolysis-stimulated lipoprotein receptor-like isoform X2 [Anas acuta]|uniref:lipolysis-stimulated lipoprotein receptor-like isoform X2 n=1 Tax=Anas acuta TaxID=28680 RepID=UPI0035C93FFA